MKKLLFLLALSILLPFTLPAQQAIDESRTDRLTPKEFSIPASPIFDLMGVTPSQVNRTSDIKDFKVDWSFKSWRLSPNLAIQSQPIWELFYNRKDLSKYQKASPLLRRLASLDLSVGSVQNDDNDRRIGFAAKINLIKKKDPLMAIELYEDIGIRFAEEKTNLEEKLLETKLQLDTTTNIMEKPSLRNEITSLEEQINSINSRRREEINQRAGIFISENWNAASLDIAFGRIYTYKTDEEGSFKSLRLDRNTGWGAWVNGTLPLGKKWLIAGLLRTTWYEEELSFLLQDPITLEETETTAIANNRIYSIGLNLRYGGPVYSFFIESLLERKAIKTPADALNKVFTEPVDKEIVESSVKWSPIHPNAITIGGDWRISRNVVLNYGMRWIMDKNFKTQSFVPIVGISCMMR